MLTHKIKILLISIFSAFQLNAHPVIYKGGFDVETESSPMMTNIMTAYTFHSQASVGIEYFKYLPASLPGSREFYFAKFNYRPFRLNADDSQANIYLSVGTGLQRKDNELTSSSIGEFHADWESRDYYVSGFQKYISLKDEDPLWLSRARLGFSPFRADYNDVNIWFITQFEKTNGEHWETTPLMRTFYKNILWELGASLNGNYLLNFMIHL